MINAGENSLWDSHIIETMVKCRAQLADTFNLMHGFEGEAFCNGGIETATQINAFIGQLYKLTDSTWDIAEGLEYPDLPAPDDLGMEDAGEDE